MDCLELLGVGRICCFYGGLLLTVYSNRRGQNGTCWRSV